MRHPYDDDEQWAGFEAALRRVVRPGPDPSLRQRCLPSGTRRHGDAATRRPTGPWRRRVLVVDDEPNIRRLLEVHLAAAGYEVTEAATGIEALEQVEANRPDLIVLDVMMPGPDGFQVLDILKGDPATVEIPILMLTAKDGYDDILRGWRKGADFYLGKPFNPEELRKVIDRMAAVIGTPENPPPLRRWAK